MFQFFDMLGEDAYDFYFKVDLDCYVNADRFKRLLSLIDVKKRWSGYFGKSAMGRLDEFAVLGLNQSYCLGLGYALTRSTVRAVARAAPRCIAAFVSNHSDTEVFLSFQINCLF